MEKFVQKKLIDDIETDEYQDDYLAQELGIPFDYEEDELVTFHEGHGSPDTQPIRIDLLISELEKMKSKGATHVEIDFHWDHCTYEIAGYEYTQATPEQIDTYLTAKAERIEKDKKIQELQEQIKTIRNS